MKINKLALIKIVLVSIFLNFYFPTIAQKVSIPVMNWLTFEQAAEAVKANPRPVLIYFYNPANDSSDLMLQTTFTQKEVCLYSYTKFHSIKFDITSSHDITFLNGKVYHKDPSKPFNDLAYFLLGTNPDVPSTLMYDDQNKGFAFKGFKDYSEMICAMVYISENVNKTARYEVWRPAYFRTFPTDRKANRIPMAVNWISLKDALIKNKQNPKGIFLTFYAKSNASSTVMLVNAFSHNKVAGYLNDNFYCVRIDVNTTDTLVWDKKYMNPKSDDNIHELPKAFMKGNVKLPAIFFFDGANNLILNESSYLSPEALYMLSNYVVGKEYEKQAFADFIKTFKFEFEDIVPREHQQ